MPLTEKNGFVYDIKQLTFPVSLLYEDEFLQTIPRRTHHLAGWKIPSKIFTILFQMTPGIVELDIDFCIFTVEGLASLKGCKTLNKVSMRNTILIDKRVSNLITSWTALHTLDISENAVQLIAFQQMSFSCKALKVIFCESCAGLDDLCLTRLGDLAQRHKTLTEIYLDSCKGFTDEGLLSLMAGACPYITTLSFAHTNCTTLSMAAFSKKNTSLRCLNISSLKLSSSAFEYIAVGLPQLCTLDMSHSPFLDDLSLLTIAQKCRFLTHLNISHCTALTDQGMQKIFLEMSKTLRVLNLSEVVTVGSLAANGLSTLIHLTSLKMNGLSQISSQALRQLLTSLTKLKHFSLNVELYEVLLHRRSLIPHLNDEVLQSMRCKDLVSLSLSGVCRITDLGLVSIAQYSLLLAEINISYCSQLTDESLFAIAKYSSCLTHFNVSSCGKITDAGIAAVCSSCLRLHHLEAVGCAIGNISVSATFQLSFLHTLNLQNCSNISDAPFLQSLVRCRGYLRLKHITLSGLDLISAATIRLLAHHCPMLIELNAESCSFTSREFHSLVKYLPFASGKKGHAKLEKRPGCIVEYNKHILTMESKACHVKKINRFIRWAVHFQLFQNLKGKYQHAAQRIQRFFQACLKRKHFRGIVVLQVQAHQNALRLQSVMRRLMGLYFARHRLKALRYRVNVEFNFIYFTVYFMVFFIGELGDHSPGKLSWSPVLQMVQEDAFSASVLFLL